MEATARRAIERDFPGIQLGRVATLESWRKEVHRPIYHIHKWWATRLGSVFRGILLGALLDESADVWSEFYRPQDFSGQIVLDPFMGSGTTLGEALKLGCRVVGCDINPLSYFLVRQAFSRIDVEALERGFRRLEERVAPVLRPYYVSSWQGEEADLLYAFWVKTVPCPDCGRDSRLFSKWIFSSHAYPRRHPGAHCLCPACEAIFPLAHDDKTARCPECRHEFNPQSGPARRTTFCCEHCGRTHPIAHTYRQLDGPPAHHMYALRLLRGDGTKVYKRVDDSDRARYEAAAEQFRIGGLPFPNDEIPPGYNTDQARGYNYRYWYQMFNERQLFSLGILLREIMEEQDPDVRRQFLLLFSGTLEFNNMFCSFKGEGTGAVRHLFHHHILKPERTPLENNPWGTPKSSGSFSTLYRRRLLAGRRYAERPYEIRAIRASGRDTAEQVHGLNYPIAPRLAASFHELESGQADALLLCGDAAALPIPDGSVDIVVTDPPYFDNVHYSELADFFYVWLKLGLSHELPAFRLPSSRRDAEVHGTRADQFESALGGVFQECGRTLRAQGLLVFTFHHRRFEAWQAVAKALCQASLRVVATHAIKGEMSVAAPKSQAKEPIDLDMIIVCRKSEPGRTASVDEGAAASCLLERAAQAVGRFNASGKRLSRGDVQVIVMGEYLKHATNKSRQMLDDPLHERLLALLQKGIDRLHGEQHGEVGKSARSSTYVQLRLSNGLKW